MTLNELSKYFQLQERLTRNEETLASLQAASQPGAQVLTGMPHAPGVSDTVGRFVVEVADLEERIRYLRKEVKKAEKKNEAFIQTIQDERTRTIFRLRFIHCLTWGGVAKAMGGGNTSSGMRMVCCRYLDAENAAKSGRK